MATDEESEILLFRKPSPKGRQRVGKYKKPIATTKRVKKKLSDMNIAIYLRKSSEEEEKQFNSIGDQEKKCLAFIQHLEEEQGEKLNIVKVYKEHHSAAHAGERELFNEMLEGIRAGKIDAILAYHPDRLSRNMLEAGIILDMVRPEKGEDVGILQDLLFPTVAFSNDSGGRLMLAVLFSMATQYSDHLSEVVQRGVDENFLRGKSSGHHKWGYTCDTVSNYYKPDEKSFDLMRKGWEMLLAGKSQAAVLDFWRDHDLHYYTKEASNKKSKKITIKSPTQINRIIKDPFYYGVFTQAGREVDLRTIPEADFEPMITEDEYNQIQAMLDRGYQTHRKAEEPEIFIPFQGMIFCKECGRKLVGYANKKRQLIYYGHQSKYASKDDCGRLADKTVSKEIRGNVILDEIYHTLDNIKPTREDYERYLRVAKEYTGERKEEMIHERHSKAGIMSRYQDELSKEIKRYKVLAEQENTPKVVLDDSKKKISELQQNIERLSQETGELDKKINRPEQIILTETEFLNFLKNAPEQMRKGDFRTKDLIARSLFLNIEIDKQNKAIFLCKPEFDGLIKSAKIHNGGDMWT